MWPDLVAISLAELKGTKILACQAGVAETIRVSNLCQAHRNGLGMASWARTTPFMVICVSLCISRSSLRCHDLGFSFIHVSRNLRRYSRLSTRSAGDLWSFLPSFLLVPLIGLFDHLFPSSSYFNASLADRQYHYLLTIERSSSWRCYWYRHSLDQRSNNS